MATGLYTDMVIFNAQFYSGFTETLQQNVNAFNAASAGALRLTARDIKGHYEEGSFVDVVSGLVSRRDISSVSAATDTAMTMDEEIGVKLNRKLGPIANTIDSWRKIGQNVDEMAFKLGEQSAVAVATDYLNTALRALEGALDNVAALEHASIGATADVADLVDGLAKFGDQSSRIAMWVMHSKVYFDIVKDQIADNILNITDMVIKGGVPATLGRPVLVTDSAALIGSVSTTVYSTLGLVPGAAEIVESERQEVVFDRITGLENLVYRFQGEYAFNLKLKGFKWDTSAGGVNPTDNAVATGSNWDQAVTSVKLLPGVIVKTL